MITQNVQSRGMNILIGIAAVVIIIAGIYLAQSIIVLLLVSIFLSLLAAPAVFWLKKKGINTVFSVTIVMTCMLIVLALISLPIAASISSYSDELPMLQSRIRQQIAEFSVVLDGMGITDSEKILLNYINPESIMKLTSGLLAGLSSALSDLLLILLTVAFVLLEASSFPKKLRIIMGDPDIAFPQVIKFVLDIKRYMIIKTIINLAAGILITAWMYILGIQFPILWGFLVFIFHYVPNIGAILAVVPAAIFAFVQIGIGSAVLVVTGNLIVGFIIGNMLEPRIMGRSLGLSTLVVFLSLILWGGLLGLIGAILCIPLTMTLKLAFESNKNTHWIAVLLGSEKFIDDAESPRKEF